MALRGVGGDCKALLSQDRKSADNPFSRSSEKEQQNPFFREKRTQKVAPRAAGWVGWGCTHGTPVSLFHH